MVAARGCRGGEPVIYSVLLVAGVVGLAVMALLGFAHGHADHVHHHSVDVNVDHGAGGGQFGHGAHAHPPSGHSGPHGHHAPGNHGDPGRHGHHDSGGHGDQNGGTGSPAAAGTVLLRLLPFVSPMNWFSWAVGAGATGLLLRTVLGEPWLALAAVVGAVLFNLGVVKPIWRLVFSFMSPPAGNLDACLLQSVEAVTRFNGRGEGLVRVLIDGRSEDVLARLTDEELRRGLRVQRGDRLLIEEVDPATNSCRVCRG